MLPTHQQLHKGNHSLRQLLPQAQLMVPLPFHESLSPEGAYASGFNFFWITFFITTQNLVADSNPRLPRPTHTPTLHGKHPCRQL